MLLSPVVPLRYSYSPEYFKVLRVGHERTTILQRSGVMESNQFATLCPALRELWSQWFVVRPRLGFE
jgi:hypothetical protein